MEYTESGNVNLFIRSIFSFSINALSYFVVPVIGKFIIGQEMKFPFLSSFVWTLCQDSINYIIYNLIYIKF